MKWSNNMSFMGLDLDRKLKGAYLQIRLLVSIPSCFNRPSRILSYPLKGEANIIYSQFSLLWPFDSYWRIWVKLLIADVWIYGHIFLVYFIECFWFSGAGFNIDMFSFCKDHYSFVVLWKNLLKTPINNKKKFLWILYILLRLTASV